MNKLRGTLLLLITALIWGLAFVAQSSVSDSLGSFTFNAARSVLAAVFLLGVLGVRRLVRRVKLPKTQPSPPADFKKSLAAGAVCGLIMFVACNLQQFGIAAYPPEAASSGRAGFITATYVVMVAVVSLFTRSKPRLNVLISVAVCVFGMYLLCLSGGVSGIYSGDLLVLLCAVGYTVYIFAVDRFSTLDGVLISCVQFAVCALISAAAAFIFETPDIGSLSDAWLQIFYAGVFSSGIGYTLQIIGQKYAAPTVASVVMSLESVFSAVFGWLILNQRLGGAELCGCVLVFSAVILAQLPDFPRKKVKTLQ